jgi:aspartyl-tRNA synthetase
VDVAKTHKAKGLAWITLPEDGTIKSTISKFFTDEQLREIASKFNAKPGDLILLCADMNNIVFDALGAVRTDIARRKEIPLEGYNFLWVTKFPLLEWSPEEQRYFASTHPFTSPVEDEVPLLETDPSKVCSRSYDLVLNGVELGSGSVRIHQQELQNKMFKFLGFTEETAKESFGYFLEALKYGVPPHCGIGLGLDRLIWVITGAESLRDVVAFPKVKDASCPMTHAPNNAPPAQLEELCIQIRREKDDE